jgi:hypothetical protein
MGCTQAEMRRAKYAARLLICYSSQVTTSSFKTYANERCIFYLL